ncbi:MAG: hypothetical protein APG12_01056 [Candidatus Methanofastidiosum methylothiophilum]|uniref:Uncharacterized protein n=1 Tax=Candidatus Methanofastidiosum methylothiophilum TaxID=1705564 RepID=A0A150IYH8_9EURY|nr:MAG: hypothetical protein APG10_00599 [Candidatus Methanofastidiosum methylthiophilus]KYC47912.1 MAG: hypothetical protein APG11_00791 [Candidatus Methanofastidiosum methylthiophilus]KYC50063.1 MAG: hypothetical protein APG12_01056 [Candidatus Methanofastidiosum methylthiophilus]
MKKTVYVTLIILTTLLLCSAIAISADVDGIFEMYRNKEGKIKLVSVYNEDCTECRGQEYQEKVCQLVEGGCTYCGICFSGNFGGEGAELLGSYEENKFVKTILSMSGYGDEETFIYWINLIGYRSTPKGIEYSEDGGATWNTWDGTGTLELPTELENLDIEGVFQHEDWVVSGYWTGPWYARRWIDTSHWQETGEINHDATSYNINPEGTQATWIFDDYRNWWIFELTHAQITLDGQEVWEKKTIFFEVPEAGGLPTLEPKNYGVQLLGTKYGPESIDEIPEELLKYTKEINGQLYTYTGSKLDEWIYENIYKPNHAKSFNN